VKDSDPEYEQHFRNALSNYLGVLSAADELCEEIPFDPTEPMPDNWEKDPLTLLGKYLEPLNPTRAEKTRWRKDFRRWIASHDAQWVWKNRARLAAEIVYIRDVFGSA
jgi:hypothetical protein